MAKKKVALATTEPVHDHQRGVIQDNHLKALVTSTLFQARVEPSKKGKGSYGYNVATGEFSDLIKDGVLDPAKVTRSALQNAASVSSLLLTTEAMVAEKPKKKEAAPPMPGGPGMEDMY